MPESVLHVKVERLTASEEAEHRMGPVPRSIHLVDAVKVGKHGRPLAAHEST